MGYTHYWNEKKKPEVIPARALEIIRKIVHQAYTNGIVQLEHDNPAAPIVTRKEVRFNGVGDKGHAPFFYSVEDDYKTAEGNYFNCCKTAMKPYDEVVKKVLIALKWGIGKDFSIVSDGSFTEEWLEARDAMLEKYNIETSSQQRLEIY